MGRNRKKGNAKAANPITVFTDGSADINAKASGYGYVILNSAGQVIEEGSGPLELPNNTYAEIKAVLRGIEAAAKYEPTEVTVYTDYKTIPSVLKNDIKVWQKHGWKTSKGKDVKFADLWMLLQELSNSRKVDIRWIKGHSGNKYNNRCDYLAWEAMITSANNMITRRKTKLPVS